MHGESGLSQELLDRLAEELDLHVSVGRKRKDENQMHGDELIATVRNSARSRTFITSQASNAIEIRKTVRYRLRPSKFTIGVRTSNRTYGIAVSLDQKTAKVRQGIRCQTLRQPWQWCIGGT